MKDELFHFTQINTTALQSRSRWHFLVVVLITVLFGCKDEIPELPPPEPPTPKWEVVPSLATLDVRYMIQHKGVFYLGAVDPASQQTEVINGDVYYIEDRGVVYKTTDAVRWTKIKGFKRDVGPMTFRDDTLYCLTDKFIYKLFPNGEWDTAFPTPPRLGDAYANGDMVFIGDKLYAMQTFIGNAVETYRIYPDGMYEEVPGPDGLEHYGGAKYIKMNVDNKEKVYLRPHWNGGGFLSFDGYQYQQLHTGLALPDLRESPSNAMAIKGDTLIAGFGGSVYPGVLLMLINDRWFQYLDTLIYSRAAYHVRPTLFAQPTAIAYAGNKLFVATNSQGVLAWKEEQGWERLSDGLKPGYIPGINEPDLKHPLPFLEYFAGKLIAAYGKPGYGPWGEVGVYTYQLN